MNRKTLSLLVGALWFSGCEYPVPARFDDIAEAIFSYQLASQKVAPEEAHRIRFVCAPWG